RVRARPRGERLPRKDPRGPPSARRAAPAARSRHAGDGGGARGRRASRAPSRRGNRPPAGLAVLSSRGRGEGAATRAVVLCPRGAQGGRGAAAGTRRPHARRGAGGGGGGRPGPAPPNARRARRNGGPPGGV